MTRQIPAVKVFWLVMAFGVVHCDAMEGRHGRKKSFTAGECSGEYEKILT
jgi:hypothetical protein